jgi:hypothetical protein
LKKPAGSGDDADFAMLEDRQKFHSPGGALAHICIDGIGERCKME